MKQPTFAEAFAAGFCLVCIIFSGIEFVYIAHNPKCLTDAVATGFLTGISAAILAAFAKAYTFILGSSASSQSKDTAILNSTPIETKN